VEGAEQLGGAHGAARPLPTLGLLPVAAAAARAHPTQPHLPSAAQASAFTRPVWPPPTPAVAAAFSSSAPQPLRLEPRLASTPPRLRSPLRPRLRAWTSARPPEALPAMMASLWPLSTSTTRSVSAARSAAEQQAAGRGDGGGRHRDEVQGAAGW
jgi:hypothetical protein